MRLYSLILVSILASIIISGCATVFSGYDAEIKIHHAPDSLRVFTSDGVELPVPSYKTKIDSVSSYTHVRSNRDYILFLKVGSSEYRYPVYAKLSGWWFALDLICGGVPMIVDALTGNWNYYDAIEYNK